MTKLQYLEDIIDLKIKSVNDLTEYKREKYAKIEQRVKTRYKAPSLPAYLLYEYHFNSHTLKSLGCKLKEPTTTVYLIMKDLRIPTRNLSESNKINIIVLEQRVKEKYGMSLYRYVKKRYCKDDWSIREIAKDIGTSHTTVYNVMEAKGIERRTPMEARNARIKKLQKKKKARRKGK